MRQRLIYILKHNMAVQKLYRVIMSFLFRLWGLFIRTDDRVILFVSYMGTGFNDSPRAVYDYMQGHPDIKGYYCIWAFDHPEKYPGLNTVKIDTFGYFRTALKAKYWVTNTNIERGLKFKKSDQVYLNTWHGVALKYIGNDCPGRKDFDFSNVDYLVVSGDYDEKVFRSAFNADKNSYLRCGMPRNEELWHCDEEKKLAMRQKLGIPDDKKAILYAPTWRDSTDGGKSYEIKPPIDFDRWKKELGGEYVILFRAHHQTTKVLGVRFDDFVKDVSDYPAVNDLMCASDMLITDYSAIAFDYSILCRPILTYAYDYDSYLASRGTYFDMDEVYPEKSCRTEDELMEKIKNLDYAGSSERAKAFRERFIQYGEDSSKICVEALLGH